MKHFSFYLKPFVGKKKKTRTLIEREQEIESLQLKQQGYETTISNIKGTNVATQFIVTFILTSTHFT